MGGRGGGLGSFDFFPQGSLTLFCSPFEFISSSFERSCYMLSIAHLIATIRLLNSSRRVPPPGDPLGGSPGAAGGWVGGETEAV